MKRNNKKGFTIVELVIVIAVIAILSAVLIPTFGGIVEKANESARDQEAANIYKNYLIDHDYVNVPLETLKGVILVQGHVYYIEAGQLETEGDQDEGTLPANYVTTAVNGVNLYCASHVDAEPSTGEDDPVGNGVCDNCGADV